MPLSLASPLAPAATALLPVGALLDLFQIFLGESDWEVLVFGGVSVGCRTRAFKGE